MSLRDRINAILGQFATTVGLAELELDAADSIQLAFDKLEVLIELDDARKRLVFSCELGIPPAGTEVVLHPLLLSNNLLWNDLDLYFALDGATGQVLLFRPVAAVELDQAAFEHHLAEVLQFGERWAEIIAEPAKLRTGLPATKPWSKTSSAAPARGGG